MVSGIELIIVVFSTIGGGLKFIDDAFDEGIFSKRSAFLLAPAPITVWMYISLVDTISATILFAILTGVLLTGKIDNTIFKTSATSIVLMALLSGKISILWPPFLMLVLVGVVDEIGNNYIDNNRTNKAVEFFFAHRFAMKIGVLLLCAVSVFPWAYLLAFLAFDMSYDLVGMIGHWMMDGRPSLNASRYGEITVGVLTTTVLLLSEVPKDLSWTFYLPERRVKFTSVLSSVVLK